MQGLPIVLLAPTEHNDDIHTALDPPMSGSSECMLWHLGSLPA